MAVRGAENPQGLRVTKMAAAVLEEIFNHIKEEKKMFDDLLADVAEAVLKEVLEDLFD